MINKELIKDKIEYVKYVKNIKREENELKLYK